VLRAHEVEEWRTAQVAHIEKSKFPEAHEDSSGARILVRVARGQRMLRARSIRSASARQCLIESCTRRTYNRDLDIIQGQAVSRPRLDVPLGFAPQLRVQRKRFARFRVRRRRMRMRSTMINKRSNRHQLRKLAYAADRIDMEMRNQQVVDPRKAGVFRGRNDAVRVAGLAWISRAESLTVARPPCVDEQA